MDALFQSSVQSEFEVVVVNDGVDQELDQVLSPYELTEIRAVPIRNAGAARNLGASKFEGDVLVFLDSDVLVERRAIERLVVSIRDGSAEAVVGSYSDDVEGLNFWQAYKQLYVSNAYSRRHGYLSGEFWTALSAIKNSVFSDLGGFSTAFAGATGEDTELGQRLSRHGYRILAVPEARGKHLKKLNLPALIRNDFRKGMKSFHLLLTNKSRVTEFRHSTSKDIGAVVTAYSLLTSTILPIWLSPALMLVVTTSYLYSRSDLLKVYRKQGRPFLLKSVLLMYLLDLVRGVCVALELLRVCERKFCLVLRRSWSLPRLRLR